MKIRHWLINHLLLLVLTACAPSAPFWHWGDVIPGESSKDDVEALLGPRDPPIPGYKFNQWKYESFGDIEPFVCESQCEGRLDVFFEDGDVSSIQLTFDYENRPPVSNLFAHLSEPSLIGGFMGPYNCSGSHYHELGFTNEQLFKMVSAWVYVYVDEGILVWIGPIELEGQNGIYTLLPRDSNLPADTPIRSITLSDPSLLQLNEPSEFFTPKNRWYVRVP